MTYTEPFLVTGSNIYYYSTDTASNIESEVEEEINIDKTAPSTPTVTDDGEFSTAKDRLHAQWASQDPETGIVEYEYAIGTTPGTNDIAGWVPIGIFTEATAIGLNLEDGETYYFAVRAKNAAGSWSEIGVTDGILVNSGQNEKELYLYTGWNFFSICYKLNDPAISTFLEPIEGKYKSVWTYDASTGMWKNFIPGDPLSDLDIIETGKAYWICMTEDYVITVKGSLIIDTGIDLFQGWNMAGYESSEIIGHQQALFTIDGDYSCIWTYDNQIKQWIVYTPDHPNLLEIIEQLEPNRGYLIYMKRNGRWEISP